MQTQTDESAIRLAIKQVVDECEASTVAEVTGAVADRCGCTEVDVVDTLDQLQDHGLVYVRGGGSDAEVVIP